MSAKLGRFIPPSSNICSNRLSGTRTWESHDPALIRPVAAPLEQCAKLLRVELSIVRQAAAHVEPYIRVDGTKVWNLTHLKRRLRPNAYGRVRGGYITRRRLRDSDT